MGLLKTSLVCTVLNEEKTIQGLIDSISNQSALPNEVIFVDGGSNDKTTEIIHKNIKIFSQLNIKLIIKKGNRSVGRNEAIKKSKGNIILSTDAGCVLDKKWVENIIKPFYNKSIDIVAGYYKGNAKNAFEKSLTPYVLVMEDKINSNDFLPATRSMAFRKEVWLKLRGFNENLSHNEDYEFANRLKNKGFKIIFEKKAIVYWIPRQNILQSFKMFARFAYGDIEAGLLRDKVIYIFLRYLFGVYLILLSFIEKSQILNLTVLALILGYVFWSIQKNYKYVYDIKGMVFLPLLQITSDIAVITGSTLAIINKVSIKKVINIVFANKILAVFILFYSGIILSLINWGIPNPSHPFNYFMDEWHQAQSVRNFFTYGTPNIPGSANGSIFHFFLTGLYLVPFTLFGIIDPFAIRSPVTDLEFQQALFQVLRTNTLVFGVLSIIVFYYLSKKFFKINPVLSTFVFVFNPVWVMLSNYFKYDIALMFWTLVSFVFMLRYIGKPNIRDLLLASVFSAIALSVKLSPFALPILLIIIFFLFTNNYKHKIKWILSSLFIYLVTFFALGIPDILLGKGSLSEYLSSVLLTTPSFNESNLIINDNVWKYLFINIYPALFGNVLFFVGTLYIVFLFTYIGLKFIKTKNIHSIIPKEQLFLFVSFMLFLLSLIPLKLDASNNRALILLPFFTIFFGLFLEMIKNVIKNKILFYSFVVFILSFQLIQTYSWIKIKTSQDPRQSSSKWIFDNIPKNSSIGIENIPIYKTLPDLILKDYYANQLNGSSLYNYVILDKNTNLFPKYIVLTNKEIENYYFKNLNYKLIKKTLSNNQYKRITVFYPDFKYLNYFTSNFNYYLTGIVQIPVDISVYEKK